MRVLAIEWRTRELLSSYKTPVHGAVRFPMELSCGPQKTYNVHNNVRLFT